MQRASDTDWFSGLYEKCYDLIRCYLLLFVNGQARTRHRELDHKHQEQDNHVLITMG